MQEELSIMQTIITTAKDLLTKYDLKFTPAREAILRICLNYAKPLDVNFVAGKMAQKAHLATIYRTLETFVKIGIIERIDFQEGKFRYEYKSVHHHHAICNSCGKVEDVSDEGIVKIEQKIMAKTGFFPTKHILELFGICSQCQTKGIYA